MTRINWDEVHQLSRLDEIIAYSIITLQEAYTAPNNYDLDVDTKQDVSDWVRWEIAYDEQGRAFFRYAASLYVVDRNPLGDLDFLSLINAPTKYLVNHASVGIDARLGDTSLKIDTLTDIPPEVVSMEQLLFWAIVLGNWMNKILLHLADTPLSTPIEPEMLYIFADPANWSLEGLVQPAQPPNENPPAPSIDNQFDAYNGRIDNGNLPDFLQGILDRSPRGTGNIKQDVDLPGRDAGAYRETLTTCEEQDPAIKNYSQQQLETLLPNK
jgi:hypothetical protein